MPGTTFHALAEQTGVAVNTVKNIARDLIENSPKPFVTKPRSSWVLTK
uniref:Uncharacterized protein n=1 Tax=Klebsiella pneumoniae TaxID=573 RepID=A0A2P1BP95_KLEPN|nr:hypothetical protein [Klebsiella pneumoniae]